MRLVDEPVPNTKQANARNNNNAVHAAENVTYQQVRGTYKYLPFVFRSTGERVNMYPGYTRKEDAVEAVRNLLASNATLQATPRL